PVEAERLAEVLALESAAAAREIVDSLRTRLDAEGRALQVMEVGGGFRLATIGYRQPVSRPEVDAVRGVNSEAVLDNLLERRMIRIAGRKDSPGRPFL